MNPRYFNPNFDGNLKNFQNTELDMRLGNCKGQCQFCPYKSICNYHKNPDMSVQHTRKRILDFFKKNPDPNDEQIHKLAGDLGINKHQFEKIIYGMLSDLIQSY